MMDIPFIHGDLLPDNLPLREYLPVYRSGIVSSWLKQISPSSRLILFPFGGSPAAVIEAAQSGYQCLVPIHNPITRFTLNRLTQSIPEEALNAALVRLASSYRGKERLKPHILSLYETDCPACGKRISANQFIWSKSRKIPLKKLCSCSHCLELTESELTSEDLQKALSFRENSPTHARALIRVSSPDDPIRFQVENALNTYPPRTLYALFTVLNKITGQELSENEILELETILLYGFYRCSSPGTPISEDTFLEENVWFVLEESPQAWNSLQGNLSVSSWPSIPPENGGITIFPGRLRELIPQLSGLDIGAIWMLFPQPALTYWALSALWTGWLWGQEAASPLHSVLSLQEYSWTWLAEAVESALSDLWEFLPNGTPCFGLLPKLEIDSLLSSLIAGSSAGFKLESIALDTDIQQGQTTWISGEPEERNLTPEMIRETIRSEGFDLLQTAGEPKSTIALYCSGATRLAINNSLPFISEGNLTDEYKQLLIHFEENIAYRQGFLHYPEKDLWWHQELAISPQPDSDKVEESLVHFLVKADRPVSEIEVMDHVYRGFPGMRSPRRDLIMNCISSYGEMIPDRIKEWKLRTNDKPVNRRKDIKEITKIITDLGRQLGYEVKENDPLGNIIRLDWYVENSLTHTFFISASGQLNRIVASNPKNGLNRWIILPGSRAELIHYKIRFNPPLAAELDEEWGLVKYRHIRRLAEEGGVTNDNLIERLALDPFISESRQLKLI
jgi:hypothetical protein